jgi:hypothetical protein
MSAKKKRVYPAVTKAHFRINTRIRADQNRFIKSYAKKLGVSEAEAHRAIIDNFMINA